jgi:sulfonate transport system substrate-binding protein
MKRRLFTKAGSALLGLGVLMSLSLGAQGKQDIRFLPEKVEESNHIAQVDSSVRIGYQKYGTVNILKARQELEKRFKTKGVKVDWILFPAGPQLLEALNAGSIDFGHTGEAPPIFAQAAGAPLLYVGNEPPNPRGEAIIVLKDSPIKTIKDLKGKRVAFNKGSNVQYLVVKALEEAGLKYTDIKPVYLPPADARAAFEQRQVDAWAIWDPFLSAARAATGARTVRDGRGIVANREFYLASKPFAQKYPDRLKVILGGIATIDNWAKNNPKGVAKLLAPQIGISEEVLEQISRSRPYGIQSIKPDVIAYQQDIANTFLKLGLLPKPIQVKQATQIVSK